MTELQEGLLRWYDHNRRDLPWRRDRDPYRVWVSEVMLQQTTVKTATPYFLAFLARFPSVAALAAASEEDVLTQWSGLGYYHRARNLRLGAVHLRDAHRGRFPRTLEAALAVPGVGVYTASAVLSIAYDLPLAVVDGNVRRVLARLFALRGPDFARDAAFQTRAQELLFPGRPGDWNQAVMELGATVCTPRQPVCPRCPLRTRCQAFAHGLQEELPEAKVRRAIVDVQVAAAVVERQGRFLLVRRRAGRLMGRMWEVPQTGLESRGRQDLERDLLASHGLEIVAGSLLGETRHAITFRRIRAFAYSARLVKEPLNDRDRLLWARLEDLKDLPLSSLTRKLLETSRGAQLTLVPTGAEP